MKANGSGFSRVLRAGNCSMAGLKAAWQHEAAFRQEVLLGLVLAIIAGFLSHNLADWLHLIAPIFLVFIIELINSAIEALADRITQEWDDFIKRAKDIGSAAVLLSFVYLALVWLNFIWVEV